MTKEQTFQLIATFAAYIYLAVCQQVPGPQPPHKVFRIVLCSTRIHSRLSLLISRSPLNFADDWSTSAKEAHPGSRAPSVSFDDGLHGWLIFLVILPFTPWFSMKSVQPARNPAGATS